MYSNIVVTGEFAWAPSSGVLGGNDVNPGTNKANIDGADFEEESGDQRRTRFQIWTLTCLEWLVG